MLRLWKKWNDSFIAGTNVNLYNNFGNKFGGFSENWVQLYQKKNKKKQKKKKRKQTIKQKKNQKTAITLLCIYQKENPSNHNSQKLETTQISLNQKKKRIKKMWYTYTVEYFTAIKNKDNLKFVQKIDGAIKYHHE